MRLANDGVARQAPAKRFGDIAGAETVAPHFLECLNLLFRPAHLLKLRKSLDESIHSADKSGFDMALP
jgi:hypothetical protein